MPTVGKAIAHIIHINEEQAEIVRQIFREHLAGRSLALITTGLNADRVPAPRSMKRKGPQRQLLVPLGDNHTSRSC